MFYSVALKASVLNFMDVVYCPSCVVFGEWVSEWLLFKANSAIVQLYRTN